MKAGRDLLAAAPGNPEGFEFFAQLCFGLGHPEEGLDALRRAVPPTRPRAGVVLRLAETLAGQYQTEEAIEMYWRAFDRARISITSLRWSRELTELYLQRGQLDRLFARLQNQERDDRGPGEEDAAAATWPCAWPGPCVLRRPGRAGAELEKLLATDTRDTRLLEQLSKLAEEEGDLETRRPLSETARRAGLKRRRAGALASLLANRATSKRPRPSGQKPPRARTSRSASSTRSTTSSSNEKPLPVLELAEARFAHEPEDWEESTARASPSNSSAGSPRRRRDAEARRSDRGRR